MTNQQLFNRTTYQQKEGLNARKKNIEGWDNAQLVHSGVTDLENRRNRVLIGERFLFLWTKESDLSKKSRQMKGNLVRKWSSCKKICSDLTGAFINESRRVKLGVMLGLQQFGLCRWGYNSLDYLVGLTRWVYNNLIIKLGLQKLRYDTENSMKLTFLVTNFTNNPKTRNSDFDFRHFSVLFLSLARRYNFLLFLLPYFSTFLYFLLFFFAFLCCILMLAGKKFIHLHWFMPFRCLPKVSDEIWRQKLKGPLEF